MWNAEYQYACWGYPPNIRRPQEEYPDQSRQQPYEQPYQQPEWYPQYTCPQYPFDGQTGYYNNTYQYQWDSYPSRGRPYRGRSIRGGTRTHSRWNSIVRSPLLPTPVILENTSKEDSKAESSAKIDSKEDSSSLKEDCKKSSSLKEDRKESLSLKEDRKESSSLKEDCKNSSSLKEDCKNSSSLKEDCKNSSSLKEDCKNSSSLKEDCKKSSFLKEDRKESSSLKENRKEEESSLKENRKESSLKENRKESKSFKENCKESSSLKEDCKESSSLKEDRKESSSLKKDRKEESSLKEDCIKELSLKEDCKEESPLKEDCKESSFKEGKPQEAKFERVKKGEEMSRRKEAMEKSAKERSFTGERSPKSGELRNYKIPKHHCVVMDSKRNQGQKSPLAESPKRRSSEDGRPASQRSNRHSSRSRTPDRPDRRKSVTGVKDTNEAPLRNVPKVNFFRPDPQAEVQKDSARARSIANVSSAAHQPLKSIPIDAYLERNNKKVPSPDSATVHKVFPNPSPKVPEDFNDFIGYTNYLLTLLPMYNGKNTENPSEVSVSSSSGTGTNSGDNVRKDIETKESRQKGEKKLSDCDLRKPTGNSPIFTEKPLDKKKERCSPQRNFTTPDKYSPSSPTGTPTSSSPIVAATIKPKPVEPDSVTETENLHRSTVSTDNLPIPLRGSTWSAEQEDIEERLLSKLEERLVARFALESKKRRSSSSRKEHDKRRRDSSRRKHSTEQSSRSSKTRSRSVDRRKSRKRSSEGNKSTQKQPAHSTSGDNGNDEKKRRKIHLEEESLEAPLPLEPTDSTMGAGQVTPKPASAEINLVTPEHASKTCREKSVSPWETKGASFLVKSTSATMDTVSQTVSWPSFNPQLSTSSSVPTRAAADSSEEETPQRIANWLQTHSLLPPPAGPQIRQESTEVIFPSYPSPAYSVASTSSMKTVPVDPQDMEARVLEMKAKIEIIDLSSDSDNGEDNAWSALSELERLRIREACDLYFVCLRVLKSFVDRIQDASGFTEAVRVAEESSARDEIFRTFVPFCKSLEDKKKELSKSFNDEDLFGFFDDQLHKVRVPPLESAVGYEQMVGLLRQLNKRKRKKNWLRSDPSNRPDGLSIVEEVQALLHLPHDPCPTQQSLMVVMPKITHVTSMADLSPVLKEEPQVSSVAASPRIFEDPPDLPAERNQLGPSFAVEPVFNVKTEVKKCDECGDAAEIRCQSCLAASYCSRLCQTVHWKSHQYECM